MVAVPADGTDPRVLVGDPRFPTPVEPTDRLAVAEVFLDSGDGHLRLTLEGRRLGVTYSGDPLVLIEQVEHHGVCRSCGEMSPCREIRGGFEVRRLVAELDQLPTAERGES